MEPLFIDFGYGFGIFQQQAHHGPETVLCVGIVLLCLERCDTGHGTEDKHATVIAYAWRKTNAIRL